MTDSTERDIERVPHFEHTKHFFQRFFMLKRWARHFDTVAHIFCSYIQFALMPVYIGPECGRPCQRLVLSGVYIGASSFAGSVAAGSNFRVPHKCANLVIMAAEGMLLFRGN